MIEILAAWGLAFFSADPRPVRAETAEKWLPSLMTSLRSGDVAVRRCAVRALGRLGPPARKSLPDLGCTAAYDDDLQVRVLAAQAIALIDPGWAAPAP